MKFDQENIDQRREQMLEMLSQGIYNVTFTKVNGETRCMPCTLSKDIVPLTTAHETNTDNPIDFPKAKKKVNPETMSVWCTDKNEWRSFKLANVQEVVPMAKSWTVTLEEDPTTGELILPFNEEILKEAGWKEGDVLEWIDNKDGSWSLVKQQYKTSK